ncbi:MAG: hypothetical protein ABIF09_12020 [Gemmatimonadota bacterium]
MTTPKRETPPLALDRGSAGNVRREHPEQDRILRIVEPVLEFTHGRTEKAFEVFRKIAADRTLNDAAKKVERAKYSERVFKEAAPRFDSAAEKFRAERANAEREIALSLRRRSEGEEFAIVAAFRQASKKDRDEEMSRAIKNGLGYIIGAIDRAPKILSGVDPAEVAMARERWIRTQLPEVVDRLAAIEGAEGVLHRAGNALSAMHRKIMADAKDAAKAAAEREAAMKG